MARNTYAKQSLGVLQTKIKDSRVLMVGAGGIGCELLKNLVLGGWGEIHIIDLDTIDLSNLNRQFLFRQEHIKKSKAIVAKEQVSKFNPEVKIEAYHANIMDSQFNVAFFGSFDLVFNALDNVAARRHVNKMCIAADVWLIESGTTGFNGQTYPIKRGLTECYDCTPKATPKSFPVCTIRSTPSQPIHCIVWAKSYLFTEIFGVGEDETPEINHEEDADNAEEVKNLREEAVALKKIRESMGSEEFPRMVFEKVFKQDIERLRSMEDMWKNRRAPEALDYDSVARDALGVGPEVAKRDQVVWTLAENFTVFIDSLRRLSVRLDELRAGDASNSPPVLTFDKDDEDTLDFVAAAANIRSHIFGIETRSKFDIKQMAGNIIPAIATTNAAIAAMCVVQAWKILRSDVENFKNISLSRAITHRVLNADIVGKPNPLCPVCSGAYAELDVEVETAKLGDLVETLKEKCGYDEFSVSTDSGLLYDPDFEDNMEKSFKDLGIEMDSFVTVMDESDEPKVNLNLALVVKSKSSDTGTANPPLSLNIPPDFVIPKKVAPVQEPATSESTTTATAAATTNGKVWLPMHTNGTATTGVKRTASEAGLEAGLEAKKGKVAEENTNGNGVIVLDDADGEKGTNGVFGNGGIVIDDD